MLNMLGFKLNPLIGIVAGVTLVVAGLAAALPTVAVVGTVMVAGAVWRRFDRAEDRDEGAPRR